MVTRIIKNIFNKNDRICRDVKTQKVGEQHQGWVTAGIKLNKPIPTSRFKNEIESVYSKGEFPVPYKC